MKLNVPSVPSLPVATTEYRQQLRDQYTNALRLYLNQLGGAVQTLTGIDGGQFLSFPYGSFQDNTTQTAAATSTPYAVIFSAAPVLPIDSSSGVSIGLDGSNNKTKIIVDKEGVYNIQFSLQLVKTTASTGFAWVWPRVNGINVADSATKVTLSGSNAASVAAWNFFLKLSAGNYVQLMWAVDDTNTKILHEAATAFCPAIPSAIVTVNFVSASITNASV
jgi:hypothetical protein